jgi:hypothetical protein
MRMEARVAKVSTTQDDAVWQVPSGWATYIPSGHWCATAAADRVDDRRKKPLT